MATPLAHALAGYTIYAASRADGHRGIARLLLLLLLVLLANLPDFDFIPGLLVGRPALHHHGVTHTVAAAVLTSSAAATLHRTVDLPFGRLLGLSLAAYGSHLVLDFLSSDRSPPQGMPLFWPVLTAHFVSPAPLLRGVHHAPLGSENTLQWLGNIFSLRNLVALGLEICVVGPFALLAFLRAKKRNP